VYEGLGGLTALDVMDLKPAGAALATGAVLSLAGGTDEATPKGV
jgi:hypothetical protein